MFVPVQIPYLTPEVAADYRFSGPAFCIAPGLMRVQSRGYVRMKTNQPDGPLEIQPNLLSESADVEALATAVELGLDIASQPAYRDLIKRWVAPPTTISREAARAFVRRSCSAYFHAVGTCAMGSGKHAVVDAQLRVRGLDGLRIADASIMPTITSANTHAPTVMIAEAASRLIASE